MSDLEFPVCASALGVDNPLWDPFAVKMRQQIEQVEILEQKGPVLSDSLRAFRILNVLSISSSSNGATGRGHTMTGQPFEVVYTGFSPYLRVSDLSSMTMLLLAMSTILLLRRLYYL